MLLIDKAKLQRQCLAASQKELLKWIKHYDEQMRPIMKAKGYTYIQSAERTVAFVCAGEVRFNRRRYKKGNQWAVPVDEALGLPKNGRYSTEMMQVIATCATLMPYAKTAKLLSDIYQISLGTTTVNKVVKTYYQLLNDRKAYQFFNENKTPKRYAPMIYVEGDGVVVKAKASPENSHKIELAHFVIHEGATGSGKRLKLIHKHEILSLSVREARQQVLDYLYDTYAISQDTILITNSDGGHGYTPYVFKELAKALKIKHHEHFYDSYHVTQLIKQTFRVYSKDLLSQAFRAIKTHDKAELRKVFEAVESLASKEMIDSLLATKAKLLNNFQYTKPASLRGLPKQGIGVMESQHRKITYRTKRRGMYWTRKGIETISQLILMAEAGTLEEFFKGKWQEDYQKLKALETLSADDFKQSYHEDHTLPKSCQNPYLRYRYYR